MYTAILIACLLWLVSTIPAVAALPQQADPPTPSKAQAKRSSIEEGILLFEAGKWQEALDTFTAAQAAAEKQNEQETVATALLYIGRIHAQQNAHADALAAFEASALIWEKAPAPAKLLEALEAIADLYVRDQNYEQALTTYATAFHLAQEVGDTDRETALQAQLKEAEFQFQLTTNLADLEKARQSKNEAKQAAILNKLGDLYRLHGDVEDALTIYSDELALRRQLADQANVVDALRNIGRSYVALKQYAEAAAAYAEAVTTAQTLGDEERTAELLALQGELQLIQEEHADAQATFEAELALRQGLQDQKGEATAYQQLTLVYQALEQYDLAQNALEKAITLWQAQETPEKTLATQIELGRLFDLQKEYEMAVELYTSILTSTQQLADQATHMRVIYSLAEAYFKLQQYDQAAPHYKSALAFWQEAGDERNQRKTLRRLGELYLIAGNHALALEQLQSALRLAEEAQELEDVAKIHEEIAKAQSALAQWPAVLAAYQEALTLWQQLGQDEQSLDVMVKMGDFYYRQTKAYEQALSTFQSALILAQKVGDREQEAHLFQRLADTYEKQENYADAQRNYEKAITLWRKVGDSEKVQKISTDLAAVQNALQIQQMEANAQSGIVAPLANATVNGLIAVRGIANDPNFQKWQLDLLLNQDPNDATFLEVGRLVAPKVKKFVELDTTKFPNGTHTLRLRVVRTDFNYDEYTVVITIANE
jgi:tetratricopeptide (TPR) repeat protein